MVGKYEFFNKEQAIEKIAKLGVATDEDGNEYPTHKHAVVMLGHLVLTEGTYDEQGEVITEPIVSTKYAVDVLWNDDEVIEWAENVVNVANPKHSFAGIPNE